MHADTPGYTGHAFICAQDEKRMSPAQRMAALKQNKTKKGLNLYSMKFAMTKYSITLEPALQ